MATGAEILNKLIPTGGWVVTGDDFESIIYDEGVSPITKKQFNDTKAEIDANKEADTAAKLAAKSELLNRLGITAEEALLLLS